jgi:LmbE family N-acetylglucosaminyl deacetylase
MTTKNDLNPKTVLGVAAHPDDLDFGAAGTFAKWANNGTDIYYLILTDGSKGSGDRKMTSSKLVNLRRKEQQEAAKRVGVKSVEFLDYEDGKLECCMDAKKDIARAIRKIKPDVVVTMDPTMIYIAETGFINHPDHRAAGQATLDAVFPLARDHLSFPELLKEGLEPHITSIVLLINLEKQNWYEDITETIDQKMDALAAHTSQMMDASETQKMMKGIAVETGAKCDCGCAEGFMRIDVK